MNIAIASDHAGFTLKNEISAYLKEYEYQVLDFGCFNEVPVDYPDFAFPVCEAISSGEANYGILICGSGIGMSIVANKMKTIRAANCVNTEMASLSRLHNNANVLTLGARLLSYEQSKDIIDTFLKTDFEGNRHLIRVEKIHSLTGK
ncbi:MAG: ribose-5-phosphate isomerase [Ignavibacteria bacterium]|nr:ribose-5-phosphate isomerase [Ignavibacteria bacterium]